MEEPAIAQRLRYFAAAQVQRRALAQLDHERAQAYGAPPADLEVQSIAACSSEERPAVGQPRVTFFEKNDTRLATPPPRTLPPPRTPTLPLTPPPPLRTPTLPLTPPPPLRTPTLPLTSSPPFANLDPEPPPGRLLAWLARERLERQNGQVAAVLPVHDAKRSLALEATVPDLRQIRSLELAASADALQSGEQKSKVGLDNGRRGAYRLWRPR